MSDQQEHTRSPEQPITDHTDLIYKKYGTCISEIDEDNESLRGFVFDGIKALLENSEWEVLQGCIERKPAGYWDGDAVFSYVWPIAREKTDWELLNESFGPLADQAAVEMRAGGAR